jgi:transcriptional regulator with XRE-family HTH domain
MATPSGLFQHVPKVARLRREQQDLTQEELAELAGVSAATISRIENGRGASFKSIDRVLRVLGLDDWMEALKEFANAAQRRRTYGDFDLVGEPTVQAPIVFRLHPGESKSLALEIQSGQRRIFCTLNVYDFTPNLQSDLFLGE